MFEQEENVANFFFFAQGDELLLQALGLWRSRWCRVGVRRSDSLPRIYTDSTSSKIKIFTTEDTGVVHRSFAQKVRSG